MGIWQFVPPPARVGMVQNKPKHSNFNSNSGAPSRSWTRFGLHSDEGSEEEIVPITHDKHLLRIRPSGLRKYVTSFNTVAQEARAGLRKVFKGLDNSLNS